MIQEVSVVFKSSKFQLSGGMLVFLGALFWSLNSPLVKFIELDAMLVCGLRSLIAAAALSAFIRPKQLNWNIWMLVYVCSYAALCTCVILALKMTSAPIAIGMQYTATIWLFLVSVIQTKKFNMRAFIPVCIIFTGVVFFMCSGTDATSSTGNLIALAEGVIFAVMTVSSKKAAGTNVIGMTAIANIFTGLVVSLIFPASMGQIGQMTGQDWIIMVILGVIQVGGGYCFYNMGVQKVSAQKASVISLWEMILGPIWVALFLQEYPSIPVLIGFVIILAGMLLDAKLNTVSETTSEVS